MNEGERRECRLATCAEIVSEINLSVPSWILTRVLFYWLCNVVVFPLPIHCIKLCSMLMLPNTNEITKTKN